MTTTVFIWLSAQPRISAHAVGKRILCLTVFENAGIVHVGTKIFKSQNLLLKLLSKNNGFVKK